MKSEEELDKEHRKQVGKQLDIYRQAKLYGYMKIVFVAGKIKGIERLATEKF